MPRRKLTDRPRNITLSLPESLVEEVEERLKNGMGGKVPYGAWRQLTILLLKRWLQNDNRRMKKEEEEKEIYPTLEDF